MIVLDFRLINKKLCDKPRNKKKRLLNDPDQSNTRRLSEIQICKTIRQDD